MTTDREIVWKDRIVKEAQRLTGKVIEKLGFTDHGKKLSPLDRSQIGTAIVEAVTDCMLRLGTFVTAGAQDSIGGTLQQVTISDKVKLVVVPDAQPNLELLAANAGKPITIAFLNHKSYEIAREELVKAIHREQMDWVANDNGTPTLFDAQAAADEVGLPGADDLGADEFCECEAPMYATATGSECGHCGKTIVAQPAVDDGETVVVGPAPTDDELRAEAKRLSVDLGLPVSGEVAPA